MLTSPWRERQPRVLAMVAVSSGGRSGIGDVIPANLLVHKKEERAHEPRDSEGKL